VGSEREQDLARTATATGSGGAVTAEPVGVTLGRYRLERELGAGAMGVVHAAFDPDLERRIALKVLRGANATTDAKDRLMREARAMARLSHPNVVTVHEVGTAGGRDFVAMELIHGESLAEWLRATRRPAAAILESFIAAGRGIAAAHAAGIVHRDFKPHNVLRSRDGRIVVTDFGLAREADAALPPALEATLPVGSSAGARSSLSGLTVTGALLGTPAYMAPEQWRGGAVTPATDQFAYCVALWEALSGERPYPGPTFEDLRDQVARGPAALDASRIPRRIRGILRRGLDPDPALRWPDMDALLTRLVRAHRWRPLAAVGRIAALAALAAAAVVVLVVSGHPDQVAAVTCEPPARELATVWSPALRAEARGRTSDAHVAVLDTAYWSWRAARVRACGAPPQVRQVQLQCLDGALGRFDALRQASARAPDAAAEDIQAQLVDPEICRKPTAAEVPRLALAPTPDAIAAYALLGRAQTERKPSDAEILALADRATTEPCARVIAAFAFDDASNDVPRAHALMSNALSVADQCGDERLRADLLIRWIAYQREQPQIGRKGAEALDRAQIAADRVMQPDLAADLASHRLVVARQRGAFAEAFRLVDVELAGYAERHLPSRHLRAVVARNQIRLQRSDPEDLDAVAADVRTWRPIAAANHRTRLAWRLEVQDAFARFTRGDVAGAHAEFVRLWQVRPPAERPEPGRAIEGVVVDDRGLPVAGAMVAAARNLLADSAGIGLPGESGDNLQITTSDAAGRFALHGAATTGAIAAQLAERRSRPALIADRVKLVLEPTRSVTGTVAFHGIPYTHVRVTNESPDVPIPMFYAIAPVGPDGAFALSGLPLTALRLGVATAGRDGIDDWVDFRSVPASPRSVDGLALSVVDSGRRIDVVLRSAVEAPLEGAELFLIPGRQQFKTIADLLRAPINGLQHGFAWPMLGDDPPAAVAQLIRRDDLVAHFENARTGELTICACSLPGNLTDPAVVRRLQAHLSELALSCGPIAADGNRAVVPVLPQQRLE